MPIEGRRPRECVDVFRAHLSQLIAQTVTQRYMIGGIGDPERADTPMFLGFLMGDEFVRVPLETTNHGRLWFFLSQAVSAVKVGSRYRLTTRQYYYSLHGEARPD